jgi:opacity protein-like surface antigen
MFKCKLAIATGAVMALLLVASAPARAQDPVVSIEQGQAAKYVNGGVGESQTKYMQSIAKDWSLRMMFSQLKANEFIAGVNLLIIDTRGTTYLQLDNAGPLTYAMLPAGRYRITAQFDGQSQTREVSLGGKNSRDVHFHWKGKVKDDPFDGKPLGGTQVPG